MANKELTKEYIATLPDKEKQALKAELLKQGLDPVFVNYLIYGLDFQDVVTEDWKMKHESKWNEELKCWRLVHPETGDFIAEYYPFENKLVVTKHRKSATIKLDEYQVLTDESKQFS